MLNPHNSSKVDNVSNKIYCHFNSKYPETLQSLGLNQLSITKIIKTYISKHKVIDNNSVQSVINLIDNKIKNSIYSNNRRGISLQSSEHKLDTQNTIKYDTYLNNFNPIINNSGVAMNNSGVAMNNGGVAMNNSGVVMNNSGVAMNNGGVAMNNSGVAMNNGGVAMNNSGVAMNNSGVAMNNSDVTMNNKGNNNYIDAKKNIAEFQQNIDKYAVNNNSVNELNNNLEKDVSIDNLNKTLNKLKGDEDPFNENFPLENKRKGPNTTEDETREFDYYIVIDSKDRNRERDPSPNSFTIEFSPGSSNSFAPSNGYIQRGFGNVSSFRVT